MSTLKEYQADITLRMRRGDSFTSVEDEVIDPATLPDAAKAALWLYGWSFVNWRRQRREAVKHIELLVRNGADRGPARSGLALTGAGAVR